MFSLAEMSHVPRASAGRRKRVGSDNGQPGDEHSSPRPRGRPPPPRHLRLAPHLARRALPPGTDPQKGPGEHNSQSVWTVHCFLKAGNIYWKEEAAVAGFGRKAPRDQMREHLTGHGKFTVIF